MKKIPLSNYPDFALVDNDIYKKIMALGVPVNMNGSGYVGFWLNGEQVMLHRYVMNAKEHQEVDHKDLKKLNCQRYNLRLCNHSQNHANIGIRSNNKLGKKGVDFQQGRFRATIRINYKKIYLGSYDSLEEAARAYDVAAIEQWGEFANTNYPKEEYQK
jgi:hypothetical protein